VSPQALAGAVMRHGHSRRLEWPDSVYDYACILGATGQRWEPDLPGAGVDPLVYESYRAGVRQRRLAQLHAVLHVLWLIVRTVLRVAAAVCWELAALVNPKAARKARRRARRWVHDYRAYRRAVAR
jgi:hypothetical protein